MHTIDVVDGRTRYRMTVDLLNAGRRRDPDVDAVASALGLAAPAFWLERDDAGTVDASDAWPLRAVWRPAPVRLWPGRERCRSGEVIERVLAHVPCERVDDVVLVDIGDITSMACLNPLQGMRDDPALAHYLASQIDDIVDMLFEGRDTSGPLTRSNLKQLLLLVGSRPQFNGTILDAVRTIDNREFRDWLLCKCPDTDVVGCCKRFLATNGENGFTRWNVCSQSRASSGWSCA